MSPLRAIAFVLVPVSLFVGLMVATAGIAVYSPVAGVAAPLLCAQGRFDYDRQGASYRPGEYTETLTIFCVAEGGAREEMTLKAMAVAFLVYSAIALLLLFVVVLLGARRLRSRYGLGRHSTPAEIQAVLARVAPSLAPEGDGDPAERLATLKRLHEQGLITAADYDAKRAEILRGI